MQDLADVVREAEAGEGLGEAEDGEQGARGRVAVRHLRLCLLLPHLRIHRRHILCTHAALSQQRTLTLVVHTSPLQWAPMGDAGPLVSFARACTTPMPESYRKVPEGHGAHAGPCSHGFSQNSRRACLST